MGKTKIRSSKAPKKTNKKMKCTVASLVAFFASANALAFFSPKSAPPTPAVSFKDTLVGALEPAGFFDPLNFAEKADDNTLKRYREAELTHGRVSMLAVVGFLVGEAV